MAETTKKGIKGFSGCRIWPVTANSSAEYTVGQKVDVPYATRATISRSVEDITLYADDGIYDSGSEYQNETLEIELQELPLELMAQLDGADYDSETGVYSWGANSIAPELALGFKCLMRNGNHLMVQYYSGVVTMIKMDPTTRGDNRDGSRYTVTYKAGSRMADGKVNRKKESTSAADLSWLDTLDTIPAGGEG
jgi:phi13 family phage major tail protein